MRYPGTMVWGKKMICMLNFEYAVPTAIIIYLSFSFRRVTGSAAFFALDRTLYINITVKHHIFV